MGGANEAFMGWLPARLDSLDLECLEENEPATQSRKGGRKYNRNARLSR